MKKIIVGVLVIISVFIFIKCSKDDTTSEKNEFLRIVEEKITDIENKSITNIIYEYEQEKDVFWKKAIHKDSAGNILKTIEREFNENRFPIKEKIIEMGTLTSYSELKYNEKIYELELKEDFEKDGEKFVKVASNKYNYDNDGYLISIEYKKFSKDNNFKNVNGENIVHEYKLRMFPLKQSRPKGNFIITYFVEDRKMYLTKEQKEKSPKEYEKYKVGDVIETEYTKFNEEGIPLYYKTTTPECVDHPGEEWFKFEKDGLGNLITLTGYANEKFDSITAGNNEMRLEYDDNGMISSIQEFKYNPKTGQFDDFHDSKRFVWFDPKVNSVKSYIDATKEKVHICTHSETHRISLEKIEKYDQNEKIIQYFRVVYPLKEVPENPEPKLYKTIKQKFVLIKK